MSTTNIVQDTIEKNNVIFSKKWEMTHEHIDCCLEEILLLKNWVVDLESLLGLQQTALQHCQDLIAGLEETVAQLVALVKKLEKMVCRCHNRLLSLGPHYAPGEEEEMVEETEEEEEEEEDGVKLGDCLCKLLAQIDHFSQLPPPPVITIGHQPEN